MPVLAYCITESAIPIEVPGVGVGGMAVETLEHSGLRCFVSRSSSSDTMLGPPAREAALAFHRVLQEIFRQGAIIPFRFPTVLADEAEMARHLHEHAAEYHEALGRLRDLVQMEIHLGLGSSKQSLRDTGTEYLRSRQAQQSVLESTAGQFQQAGKSWISGWRQQASPHHIRCYALVSRGSVAEFERALVTVQVPSSVSARVSGPWPATEFVSEE
jgi:gas vesicle protein GvpL/GvpF